MTRTTPSAWKNEIANGLLRQYLTKGINLLVLTQTTYLKLIGVIKNEASKKASYSNELLDSI